MRGSRWALPLLLFLAAVVPHLGALRNGFVYDDRGIIVENPAVTKPDLGMIWSGPYWPETPKAGLYRPLVSTSFAIDWTIFGNRPGAFIAENLLLHALTTLLLLSLLHILLPRRKGVASVAALLFAVHPIHVEAVVGVVGRAEILASLFVLLAYRTWLTETPGSSCGRRILPAVLWALALLAKESAIALPGLLLLDRLGWISPRTDRRIRPTDLAWLAALAFVFALRLNALGMPQSPHVPLVENPLAYLDPIHRVLGAGGVLAGQILQLLTITGYSCDYSYAQVSPGIGLYAAGAIMLLVLAASTILALTRGRGTLESFGLLFFLAFWIVTSNMIISIGTAQADRLFYLPLLGVLLLGIGGVARLTRRLRLERANVAITAGLVLWCAVVSAIRSRDWHDDRRLFTTAVQVAPRSVKARMNLGMDLLQAQSPQAAADVLELLGPILTFGSNYGPLNHAEAKARMFLGQDDQALALFRKALRNGSDSARVLIEMGNIALSSGDGQQALEFFDRVARTDRLPEHTQIGRASALSLLGRFDASATVWRDVLSSLPDSVPIRIAYAWNLRGASRHEEAASVLRDGIERRNDARLWRALATTLLGFDGHGADALDAAEHAVHDAPSTESLCILARAQIAAGRVQDAIATRDRILEPDSLRTIDQLLRGLRE